MKQLFLTLVFVLWASTAFAATGAVSLSTDDHDTTGPRQDVQTANGYASWSSSNTVGTMWIEIHVKYYNSGGSQIGSLDGMVGSVHSYPEPVFHNGFSDMFTVTTSWDFIYANAPGGGIGLGYTCKNATYHYTAWLEVRAKIGNTLYFSTNQPGDTFTLGGE